MTWRWLPTYPTTDSRLYEVPTIISDNFTGIETILNVEHQTLTSGSSGQHSPGRVSAVYEGTTVQIVALTNVPEGALAYDTTIGYWKKYISSAWVVMTNVHSRMRAFLSVSTSAVTATTQSSTGDWIIFNTEDYDELAEYDNATGVFTAKGSGDYLVAISVTVCASAPIPTTSTPGTATGDETAQWAAVGGSNYQTIDEYPTPNDADYVTTRTSGAKDRYTQSKTGQEFTPLGSSGLFLTVALRVKGTGCSCDNTCYGHTCTCYNTCYGYTMCSCNAACYGESCTCNAGCYNFFDVCFQCYNVCYNHSCTCNGTCYGYAPCSCNNTCYTDTKCLCYNSCYGYSCTCHNTNYGGTPCSCNYTCYNFQKGCDCFTTCYGYSPCSCNNTTYQYVACTCNITCYVENGAACQCDAACYDQFKTTIRPLMTLSGSTGWIEYEGNIQTPTSDYQLLEYTWSVSPSTGLEWQRDELHKVGHFGLKASNDGGITTGCSAVVSQEYIMFGWYPILPVYILRIYKNDIEVEKMFCAINDAGTESDQIIGINTILTLNPGDTIRTAFVKVKDVADNIIGGATLTYMSIHRIEGQCV